MGWLQCLGRISGIRQQHLVRLKVQPLHASSPTYTILRLQLFRLENEINMIFRKAINGLFDDVANAVASIIARLV